MSAPERHRLGALADLKVVELGVWVAAPGAAALLADWGADVVKVESPSGDPMRYVFESLGIGADVANPASRWTTEVSAVSCSTCAIRRIGGTWRNSSSGRTCS